MKCLLCGHTTKHLHDLGSIAISNNLSSKEKFPLTLQFCSLCFNVQLGYFIDLKDNFIDYNYRSSIAVKDSLIDEIIQAGLQHQPRPRQVLEIASNDGYLLRAYRKAKPKLTVVGVDPAENLLKYNRGIPVYSDFFSLDVAKEIAEDYNSFELIHAHNVLAHVSNPCDLIAGIRHLLSPHGTAICDVQYLGATLEKLQFDNIYHEHFCYYSLTTLQKIFNHNGLYIYDAEIIESQGGTLRVYATPFTQSYILKQTERYKEIKESETGRLDNFNVIKSHLNKIDDLVENFKNNLLALEGSIFGYGAAAKCNVVLNLANIDQVIIGVFDDADTKIGKKIPGTSIPILDPNTFDTWDIQNIIVFPWNVMDKIIAKYPGQENKFISSRDLLFK